MRDSINSTVAIQVTVCGDEEVFLLDPEDDVFNIYFIGTPGNETWYDYDLSALFATNSSILPTDECPVTHYDICADEDCTSIFNDSSSMTINGTNFTVNTAVPIRPGQY